MWVCIYVKEIKTLSSSADDVVNGLLKTLMQRVDAWYVDGMRNQLFQTSTSSGLDIVALNIQRGRDHGLPSLNDWRVKCDLPKITSFTGGEFSPKPGKDLAKAYL